MGQLTIYYRKKDAYQYLESMLAPYWQNPVNGNLDHHRLEIEAFPMEKWRGFKLSLYETLSNNDSLADKKYSIVKLIKELESFGKPEATKNNNG